MEEHFSQRDQQVQRPSLWWSREGKGRGSEVREIARNTVIWDFVGQGQELRGG